MENRRPRLSLVQRIAWNTSSQVGGRLVSLAVGLVATILVTHHLGVPGFGDVTAVVVYISLFSVFFDLGIPTLVVRDLSRGEVDAEELIGQTLALRLLLGAAVAMVAGLLALVIYPGADDRQIRLGILLALPMIVFGAASSTLATLFQARLKMARLAVAELISQATAAGLIALAVTHGHGFYAVIGAYVIGNLVYAVLAFGFFTGLARVSLRVERTVWARILRQSLPLGISLVLLTIYFRLDAFLLSLLKGSHDVGIYGIAFRFSEMLAPLALFATSSVFPVISASTSEAERPLLLRALQRTFDVIVVAAVPVVAGTLAVAPQIVHFLAPASFDAAAEPLRIVIVGTGFSFLSTFYAYAVVAFDRQRDAIWLYAATLVFNLVLNLALIPSYGYLAAAWVATVSEILIFIGLALLTQRFVGFLPRPAVALRAIVAGAVMFGVVYPLHIRLPFAIVIGAAVYGACIVLLRVPRKIELRELLAR